MRPLIRLNYVSSGTSSADSGATWICRRRKQWCGGDWAWWVITWSFRDPEFRRTTFNDAVQHELGSCLITTMYAFTYQFIGKMYEAIVLWCPISSMPYHSTSKYSQLRTYWLHAMHAVPEHCLLPTKVGRSRPVELHAHITESKVALKIKPRRPSPPA